MGEGIRQVLLKQVQDHFALGFPRYSPQRENIAKALGQLLTPENIKAVLSPPDPIRNRDAYSFAQIKDKEISLERLRQHGILPSYTLVKLKEDDNGGDDKYDIYLHASLYLLPAPRPLAKETSSHPEDYKDNRPHIEESFLCRLPIGEQVYYVGLSAYNFGSSMVVDVKNPSLTLSHFHLAKECSDGKGNIYKTEDVLYMDGLKIYLPTLVERNGVIVENTLVLSATITVWSGWKALGIDKLGTGKEENEQAYGLGGLSEILTVLKKLP